MAFGNSGKETILVVDDGEAVRKMVCSMLDQHGYKVLEAADGVDALEIVKQSPSAVHLVLTDIIMPQMDGAELARRLSAVKPDLRVMFMSGYTETRAPVVKLQLRPAIFLAKPFTAGTLLDRVRAVLDMPWSGIPEITGDGER